MKAKEIRDLSVEEIEKRILEEEQELVNMRFKHAVGTLQNSSALRTRRRLIARLSTILTEKQQAQ